MLENYLPEKKTKKSRGNTLVFVMIAITILSLLCVTLVTLSFQVYKSTKTHGKVDYTFYSADSAIEMYINKLWIAQEESKKDFNTVTPVPIKADMENKVLQLFRRKLQLALITPVPTPTPIGPTPALPTEMPLGQPFIITTSINSYGVNKAENEEPVRITITDVSCEQIGSGPDKDYRIRVEIEAILTKRNERPVYAYKDFLVRSKPLSATPTGTPTSTPIIPGGNTATPVPTLPGGNTATPVPTIPVMNTATPVPTIPVMNTVTPLPTATSIFNPTSTPTHAASYPAWDSNNHSYKIGDIVSYSGSNYKCTYDHSSNVSWTPVAANTLWTKL